MLSPLVTAEKHEHVVIIPKYGAIRPPLAGAPQKERLRKATSLNTSTTIIFLACLTTDFFPLLHNHCNPEIL